MARATARRIGTVHQMDKLAQEILGVILPGRCIMI